MTCGGARNQRRRAKSVPAELKLPSPHDWRRTDTDGINKHRQRARDEAITIANRDPRHLIFSERERMLGLVRELCERLDPGLARHTGTAPRRGRDEINAFKNDPNCRVFLSAGSGSTGLDLQNAGVVISCNLPRNPARLEIA